jgi:hypothetical protein
MDKSALKTISKAEKVKQLENKQETLKKLYYDPKTGFTGADKLWQRAKQVTGQASNGLTITKKDVQNFLKEQKTE